MPPYVVSANSRVRSNSLLLALVENAAVVRAQAFGLILKPTALWRFSAAFFCGVFLPDRDKSAFFRAFVTESLTLPRPTCILGTEFAGQQKKPPSLFESSTYNPHSNLRTALTRGFHASTWRWQC